MSRVMPYRLDLDQVVLARVARGVRVLIALAFFWLGGAATSAQEAAADAEAGQTISLEDALRQGIELQKQGDHKGALDLFGRIQRGAPGDGNAFLLEGDSLRELGDYERAAQAYTKAIERNVATAEAYNGRGVCFLEMTNPAYDLATQDFTTALDLNRSNAEVLSNLGHMQANYTSDMESAIRHLDDALTQRDNSRDYRDRGLAKARLQEYEEAVADLNQAITLDPDDYENYYVLSSVNSAQKDYEQLIDSLTKAIERYKPKKRTDPKIFMNGYLQRAEARQMLGNDAEYDAERTRQYEAVVEDTDALIEEIGENLLYSEYKGRAYFSRGVAFRMLERYSESIDSITRAIQISANLPGGATYLAEAYLRRGICWFYQGYNDLARGDFEAAGSTGSGFGDPRIPLWIGYTYHKEGEYRQAVQQYSEAIAKKETFPLPHLNKGRAYFAMGDYDKAVRSFNNAIRVEPTNAEHYYLRGICNVKRGELEKAKESFKLALLQENRTPKMYEAMADILQKIGNGSLADQYRQQAANRGKVADE